MRKQVSLWRNTKYPSFQIWRQDLYGVIIYFILFYLQRFCIAQRKLWVNLNAKRDFCHDITFLYYCPIFFLIIGKQKNDYYAKVIKILWQTMISLLIFICQKQQITIDKECCSLKHLSKTFILMQTYHLNLRKSHV